MSYGIDRTQAKPRAFPRKAQVLLNHGDGLALALCVMHRDAVSHTPRMPRRSDPDDVGGDVRDIGPVSDVFSPEPAYRDCEEGAVAGDSSRWLRNVTGGAAEARHQSRHACRNRWLQLGACLSLVAVVTSGEIRGRTSPFSTPYVNCRPVIR
jgi:hypothetical protein